MQSYFDVWVESHPVEHPVRNALSIDFRSSSDRTGVQQSLGAAYFHSHKLKEIQSRVSLSYVNHRSRASLGFSSLAEALILQVQIFRRYI